MKKLLIMVLGAMAMCASAAADQCREISDDPTSFRATQFTYCDTQASNIRLVAENPQEYPDIYSHSAGANLTAEIETPSGTVPASIPWGWGDRAGFNLVIESPADGLVVAEAVNAGEPITMRVTNSSTGTVLDVFSGVFEMKFPEDLVPSATPEPEPEPEPVVETPAAPVVELSAFQTELLASFDRKSPYTQWMDRDCVASEAEAVRELVRTQRLEQVDAEIARLEGEIAKLGGNPRATSHLVDAVEAQQVERARLVDGTSSRLQPNMIAGNIISDGFCRDRQMAYDDTFEDCERRSRPNCDCEASTFAENWLSEEYDTDSQGLVRMSVDARTQCRS
ncbi:MAG: hypothetical protein MRY64_10325 [Hyphomonadaceae bacterium]|nr:hypothetical protein [Hyphomonadaceae bacterium]